MRFDSALTCFKYWQIKFAFHVFILFHFNSYFYFYFLHWGRSFCQKLLLTISETKYFHQETFHWSFCRYTSSLTVKKKSRYWNRPPFGTVARSVTKLLELPLWSTSKGQSRKQRDRRSDRETDKNSFWTAKTSVKVKAAQQFIITRSVSTRPDCVRAKGDNLEAIILSPHGYFLLAVSTSVPPFRPPPLCECFATSLDTETSLPTEGNPSKIQVTL